MDKHNFKVDFSKAILTQVFLSKALHLANVIEIATMSQNFETKSQRPTINILRGLHKGDKKEPKNCRIGAKDFQKRLSHSLRQKNLLTQKFRRRLESVGK